MKKENGLTLLVTIFLVILIAIFVFGIVYFTRIEVKKEELEDAKTNMLLVQAKIKKIEGDYILQKKDEILIGNKISNMSEEKSIKEFLEKELFDINEKDKKYYVLNQENLNQLGLEKILLEQDAYYIVEYNEAMIYYTKGFEDNEGKIYYSLKDFEETENKAKENEEVENNVETNKE